MPATSTPEASPRERLLAAAGELFYAEGVQTVGIDRIIEQAGVAKASLYSLFGSKEALVTAYLESRHQATAERLTRAVEREPDPRQKLLAVFAAQAEVFGTPGFNGCAFVSASTEAQPGGRIQAATHEYRGWIRGLFRDLAEQAGAREPDVLATELQMLYDGGALSVRLDGDPGVARAVRRAAEALVDREIPA